MAVQLLLVFLGSVCAATSGQDYHDRVETDYEIIHPIMKTNSPVLQYEITAFGSRINLSLQRNLHLIGPHFTTTVRDGNESRQMGRGDENGSFPNCHYLHIDEKSAAAVSLCQKNAMGLLFLPNDTLEIFPLLDAAADERNGLPHIVRKANRMPNAFHRDYIRLSEDAQQRGWYRRKSRETSRKKKLTVEAALFVDEPAYKIFAPFFGYNDQKLRDMMLAYINGVQAVFHHPSLGQPIDIVLVKMEIFKKQPIDLPHFDGERNQLLDSFCLYNKKHNSKEDSNPQHWDMGLYVSGLNFFAYENGRKSDATMGLATVNGVCTDSYNCIIAEFGTTNLLGKPYPSAGFTSVYILAHEMGHNIGMHHDSSGNSCPKEGFIMSPSRGTHGETIWSKCSARVVDEMPFAKCLEDSPNSPASNLDHSQYEDNPGQIWRAKSQCEVLIRDPDAELYNPETLQDVCENLRCKSPHKTGFYFAGPALQGTHCGHNKWCQAGQCVTKTVKPEKIVKGGWSEWKPQGECQSGCLKKSRGYQSRRRSCDNPTPINTDEGCEGPTYDVLLCKDNKICGKRITIKEYATERCKNFSEILTDLDREGLQAAHEPERLWVACSIFCKKKNNDMFYTPRIELNDAGRDPYFPDGTWCHNDGLMNYYCLQHHCLPENHKYVKESRRQDDVAFSQNAQSKDRTLPKEILQYLGLSLSGKPLSTILHPQTGKTNNDDEWTDKDYLEIP